MESWDSSNTEHRLSDHGETSKETLFNDQQSYPIYHNQSEMNVTHAARSKTTEMNINLKNNKFIFI